ncbi:MAG: hypothetical protein ACTS3T_17190 [Almyronema sp.]
MTSQQNQIQQLIAEIDAVLGKASPRLPWVMSSEASQQRQVLEKIRDYLASRTGLANVPSESGWGEAAELAELSVPATLENSAQQVLQALLQEMDYLRTQMLQPMRVEVDALQQQRDSLLKEVRLLEVERLRSPDRDELKPPLAEFLQALIEQMQETLTQRLTQTVQQSDRLLQGDRPDADVTALLNASSSQQLAQLQRLQDQSDQLLLKLDSTLTTVFEALQNSVASYQASLAQGLENMHSLGQQGEIVVSALINHLAEQLSQEASAYLAAARSPEPEQRLLMSQSEQTELAESEVADEIPPASDWNDPAAIAEAALDLDSLDLDFDFDDDDDITLLQLDEEITQLQFDQPEADTFAADEDATVIQSPLDSPAAATAADPLDKLAAFEPEPSAPTGEYREEIDTLYESLFGPEDIAAAVELSQPTTPPEAAQPPTDEATAAVDALDFLTVELAGLENLETDMATADTSAEVDSVETVDEATTSDHLDNLDQLDDLDIDSVEAVDEAATLDQLDNLDQLDDLDNEAVTPDQLENLDTLLLGETIDSVETSPEPVTLDSFFAGSESESNGHQTSEVPETIASLAELLPDHPTASFSTSDTLLAGFDETLSLSPEALTEDAYIPAPPNEDLLVDDAEANDVVELSLDLDSSVLEQLSADLSSLEGLEPEALTESDLNLSRDRSDELFPEDTPLLDELAFDFPDELASVADNEAIAPDVDPPAVSSSSSTLSDWRAFADELQADNRDDEVEETGATLEDLIAATEVEADTSETAETLSLEALSALELEDIDFSPPPADTPPPQEAPEEMPMAEPDEAIADPAWQVSLSELDNLDNLDELDNLATPDDAPSDRPNLSLETLENLSFEDLSPEADQPASPDENRAEAFSDTFDDFSLGDVAEPIGAPDPVEDRSAAELEPDFSLDLPDDLDLAWGEEAALGSAEAADQPQVPDLEPPATDDPAADGATWDTLAANLSALDASLAATSETDLDEPQPPESAVRPDIPDFESDLERDLPSATAALDESNDMLTRLPTADSAPELLTDEPNALPELAETARREPAAATLAGDSVQPSIAEVDQADQSNTLPPVEADEATHPQHWFLGIDLGTTGLSAVLMDRTNDQVYPLYWLASDAATAEETGRNFRLPAIAQLEQTTATHPPQWQIASVGLAAVPQPAHSTVSASHQLWLRHFKPLLKITVPQADLEPWLQWSEDQQLPLLTVQATLQQLLAALQDQHCAALGLTQPLTTVLSKLQGVIVGYPANWPDTYSFNIREAILAAQLVNQPEQIFFVEDAIAVVLSGLPQPVANSTPAANPQVTRQQTLYQARWQGGTVVINGGATLTELAIVSIPAELSDLKHENFTLRSFAYGGDAIDQDILCRLLYPAEMRQTRDREVRLPAAHEKNNGWNWQSASLITAADWQNLQLENLILPRAGEPDLANRHRLQQRLNSSLLGQSLLEAARYLKLILQHQSQFQLNLGNQAWTVKRRDLESRIFLPYIQRVNQQLNILLSQSGLSAPAVNQVICTGGSASLAAFARWLRQKFPNATIIQDTYPGDRPPSCSRVAYGLVNLCRYPEVLEITRQQYNDYFLLAELLRVFPDHPLPVSGIMHRLEERGINTQACQMHVLALLEGHLPPGLVPTEADFGLIAADSVERAGYATLTTAPLFTKQGNQIYVPNEAQSERLKQHLNQLLAHKQQTLDEPLIADLAAEVA